MNAQTADSAPPLDRASRHAICPFCGSTRVHRSRRRKMVEWLLTFAGGRVHRCEACSTRFVSLLASTICVRDAQRLFRKLLICGLILAAAVVVALALLFFGAYLGVLPSAEPGA
ncbi:MAG: hypothetical protein ABSH05_14810 [Bryobacteraceae bacterium]|jgi:hypothetical protein